MKLGAYYLRVAAFVCMGLMGCEKKGSNPVDSGSAQNGAVPGAPISGVQRTKVFTAMRGYMDSVARVNPGGMKSAVLKFFRATPEFM